MHFKTFLKLNPKLKTFLKLSLRIFFILVILILGTVIGTITYYSIKIRKSLPNVQEVFDQNIKFSTQIYDRNGELLYTKYGDVNREFVPLDKYPKHLIVAVLSTEDKKFYEHRGFDIIGMGRAIINLIKNKHLTGASTITQQLARNVVLPKILGSEKAAKHKDIKRKLIEVLVSIQLENKFTKDEILELYLNEVPLGGTNYGFQAAAKSYFSKDVKDLTISESAFLAGIIQAPSYYIQNVKTHPNDLDCINPENQKDAVENTEKLNIYGDPDCTAIRRRNAVLDLMLENADKFGLDKKEIEKAKEEPLKLKPAKVDIKAPHFVFYVLSELEKMYSPEIVNSGGLRVKTSLDLNVQKVAEEELKKRIKVAKTWYGVHNGAVVIINPKNGEVLAMVGSVDYNNTKDPRVDGNVNVAIMPRQMGSSVKPYTYLTAFTKGFTPGSPAPDIKFNFSNYIFENDDHKYQGVLSIAEALQRSRNMSAMYILQAIGGTETFVSTAKKLGITTLKEDYNYGLGITLGSAGMKLLEHTNAFATFANKGVQYPATVILEVKDSKGNVLYEYKPEEHAKKLFSEQETYLLNWILCNLNNDPDFINQDLYSLPKQKLCGSSGTSINHKDLVSIMYYPKLVVGVWAGNNNGEELHGTKGYGKDDKVSLPIAHNIMKQMVSKLGEEKYKKPSDIKTITVCKDTGYIAKSDNKCIKQKTISIKSQLPPVDKNHNIIYICTLNNKIPSNLAEAKSRGLVHKAIYFNYKLPNVAQNATYLNYITQTFGYFTQKPETAYCSKNSSNTSSANSPQTSIPLTSIVVYSPQNNQTFKVGDTIKISGTTAMDKPINKFRIYLDEKVIYKNSFTIINSGYYFANFDFNYQIPQNEKTGKHQIKIIAESSNHSNSTTMYINISK